MMGPADPMMYVPTWQLFIVLMLIFASIYGCGRIMEYILWQLLRCMKYLLLGFIDLYCNDDYEEINKFEDGNRRKKRDATRRIRNEGVVTSTTNTVLLEKSNSNETTERYTVPVETTLESLKIDLNNDKAVNEVMRHSPTDDEEKSKNSSSSVSPTTRHRLTEPSLVTVIPS
jgi:preprotein translocase subunit SecF